MVEFQEGKNCFLNLYVRQTPRFLDCWVSDVFHDTSSVGHVFLVSSSFLLLVFVVVVVVCCLIILPPSLFLHLCLCLSVCLISVCVCVLALRLENEFSKALSFSQVMFFTPNPPPTEVVFAHFLDQNTINGFVPPRRDSKHFLLMFCI